MTHRPTVVHLVHSLEGGGTERTLLRLLAALPRRGVDHLVATQREPGAPAEQLPFDVACCPLDVTGRDPFAGARLARRLRGRRVGVIHARGIGTWADAMIAALLTPGARLVLGFHGLETGGGFSPRHRRRVRWGRRLKARYATVSESGAAQLRQAGVSAPRIEILPNGVDVGRIRAHSSRRNPMRGQLGFRRDDVVFGCVASLTPVKGHAHLIAALADSVATAQRLRLLLVGDGPLRDDLQRQARTLSVADRVTFAGPREDVPELLSAMDGYVCSSLSEGMSNAVLEAMAAGLPIISTDVGDHRALLSFDECRLVRPGDVPALASRLSDLAVDPLRRARMGNAALARVQRFSFDRMMCAYDGFYQRLVAPRLPGPAIYSALNT